MNTLYRKIAVTSACTVLSFVLGATPEAKAASFTFTSVPASIFYEESGAVYTILPGGSNVVKATSGEIALGEIALSMEFNIGSLSMETNKIITRAVFEAKIGSFGDYYFYKVLLGKPSSLGIFGYVGNGIVEGLGGVTFSPADFAAEQFLSSVNISSLSIGDTLNFDVTEFVTQRVSNGDAFAGLTIRVLDLGNVGLESSSSNKSSPQKFSLIVQTADVAEPIPEPTTIFGSALALGLGGWLKRKKYKSAE